MQITTIEIYTRVQFARSVPSCGTPVRDGESLLFSRREHDAMFRKWAAVRQEGASRTTKSAEPRFRAKCECVAPKHIGGILRRPYRCGVFDFGGADSGDECAERSGKCLTCLPGRELPCDGTFRAENRIKFNCCNLQANQRGLKGRTACRRRRIQDWSI